MEISGTEIERINDNFNVEYSKLTSLLFNESNDIREVDMDRIKPQVDKCIIDLLRFKHLKEIK